MRDAADGGRQPRRRARSVTLHVADLLDAGRAARDRRGDSRRTRSTTSRRRRSCRSRGRPGRDDAGDRGRHRRADRRRARATRRGRASSLASSREIFGSMPRRARSARTRRAGRARRTAPRSSPPTSSSASRASATACTCRRRSSTTTSRRAAGPQYVTRKVTRAAARDQPRPRGAARRSGTSTRCATGAPARDIVRGLRAMAAAAGSPTTTCSRAASGGRVRELVGVAFACVGLDPDGHVDVDPALVREPEREPADRRPVAGARASRLGARRPPSTS